MRMLALLAALCLLTGCSSLLEREHSSVEPHSSKFWESEASDILRAESYQDIVNDLLLLVGQHTEQATLRLYELGDALQAMELVNQAIMEVQQETPMGAYAVEFITAQRKTQPGHIEVSISIGYRRTAEQIQSVVSATSAEALTSLLEAALDAERPELAVRIGYWGEDSAQQVQLTLNRLREARGLADTPPWTVNTYPSVGPVGLIEFVLQPGETAEASGETAGGSEEAAPPEGAAG